MPKSNNKTPEVPQWCKDAAEEICEGSNELASEIIFRYYEGNALPTPPAPAASEVERFTLKLAAYSGMGRMYLASKQVDDCEVVTAADHDRIIAERDAVIAELQRQVNTMQASCDMNINAASVAEELLEHERQTHKELGEIVGTDNSLAECCKRLRARAEAAEAKCAHWYDEFNRIAHQFRAAVDPDDAQKLNPEGTAKLAASLLAQLAAANDKLLVVEAERDGLREALKDLVDDICERVDMQSPSTNPGMKVAVKNAQAALASLSQQNGEGANQPVEWEKIKEANKWDNLM